MPKPAISRVRRSKSDIEKEFSKVVEEVAEQKESRDSKTEELARLRQAEIQQAAEGTSVTGGAGADCSGVVTGPRSQISGPLGVFPCTADSPSCLITGLRCDHR